MSSPGVPTEPPRATLTFVNAQVAVSFNADEYEPAWPKNNAELGSRRAFITHRVSDIPGTALWDLGPLEPTRS